MRYQDPHLCELLAAEYALGTLKGGARRRFEELLQARSDLRRRVRNWEQNLSRTLGEAPAENPSPQVWTGIENRLFPDPARPGLKDRLGFWRALSLGSGALAAVLATVLVFTLQNPDPGYLAMISDASQKPMWLVRTVGDMHQVRVKNLKPMTMPPKTYCVLWLKTEFSDRVIPLGVLPDQGDTRTLKVDDPMPPRMAGHLLVTVEILNGTMPERPTGPPVYQGEWMPLKEI